MMTNVLAIVCILPTVFLGQKWQLKHLFFAKLLIVLTSLNFYENCILTHLMSMNYEE